MDKKRQLIYLGALLHDIGKFYQRASNKTIRDINPNYDKEEFGYQHAEWTYKFFQIEEIIKTLEEVPGLKKNLYEDQTDNQFNVANLASNHHRPQSIEDAFVTLGDWWSAGIDRTEIKAINAKDYGCAKIDWETDRYKTIPLYSIFNIINKSIGNSAFPLEPLGIERHSIFPKQINVKSDGVNEDSYKKLWDKFIEDFQLLPKDSLEGFTESLTYLLKKYTWCIPSNTMDMANVSLFEHCKTTAAFADSIAEYYKSNPEDFIWNNSDKRLSLKENKYPVLLYGADISGIQKFIYNIASSKAAKSLKGRSFYLQLLIDSLIQRIITHDKIKGTIGHVIYSSGGKFFMILPNTIEVKNALEELKKEFEKEIWEEHKGRLTINTGYIGFSYRNKKVDGNWKNWIEIERKEGNSDLGELWKALAEKISIQKNQHFKLLLIDNWSEFFDEENHKLATGGDILTCSVTGEPIPSKKYSLDNDVYVSKSVFHQAKLGEALKGSNYRIIHKNSEKHKFLEKRTKRNNSIQVIGVYNYIFNKEEFSIDDADFRGVTSADISKVISLNNTDFIAVPLKGKNPSYGFQFYGGNKQGLNEKGENKTFEELTQVVNNEDKTETYLGVLRMDVDDLGDIFINGFSEKEKSFSSYATLSFLLDLFFSGYLNTIREKKKYRDFVNILYSGGDDVFAIGRWDLLIDFSEEIRNEFKSFVGREDISISAGLAIVRNKFPISKAADIAGEAEFRSKKFRNGEKDAITFFGETISWGKEFNDVKEMKVELVRLVCKNDMSHSILHKLMQYAEIKKNNDRYKNEGENDKVDLSYKWHTAYYLKRFLDRYKYDNKRINEKDRKNSEITHFISKIQMGLFEKEVNYCFVALACRWAELQLREIENRDRNE